VKLPIENSAKAGVISPRSLIHTAPAVEGEAIFQCRRVTIVWQFNHLRVKINVIRGATNTHPWQTNGIATGIKNAPGTKTGTAVFRSWSLLMGRRQLGDVLK